MRKAEPPPLSPTDTLRHSLRLIVAEGLDHFEAHQAAAHDGDAEALHQTRVALRRLRSALRLFRRFLDPAGGDGFNDLLRGLGRTLGAARDWDVFVLETLPAQPDALPSLLVPAQQQRDLAHVSLRAALDDPATAAMLLDLRHWSGSVVAFATKSSAERGIGDAAGPMLDRMARTARRRGRGLAHQDDDERHALRKALKSLRYGIEMLQSLYDGATVKPYRKALGLLQEDLGRLNDAIAAAELAGRLPERPGRAVILHWSQDHKRAALEELPATWLQFKAMPTFW